MIHIWVHRSAKYTDPVKWYRSTGDYNRKLIYEACPALQFLVGKDTTAAFNFCKNRFKYVRSAKDNEYPFMRNPESRLDWDTGLQSTAKSAEAP